MSMPFPPAWSSLRDCACIAAVRRRPPSRKRRRRSPSSPPIAGPDRTERLIAGAKKEGVVNIYSSITVDDMKVISDWLREEIRRQAAGLARQLRKHPAARAWWKRAAAATRSTRSRPARPRWNRCIARSMLQEIKSPLLADIVPAAIRPHRRMGRRPAQYHLRRLQHQSGQASRTCRRPMRTCSIPNGRASSPSRPTMRSGWARSLLPWASRRRCKYFRDLVRTNGLSLRKGHTLIANLIVSGEVPFSLTVYHYKAEQLKNAAARRSTGCVLPPGIARFLGTGVLQARAASARGRAVLRFHDARRAGACWSTTTSRRPT